MKTILLPVIATMFALSVSQSSQAQKNGGFEDWSTLEPSCYQGLLDTVYMVDGATSGDLNHWVENYDGLFFCGTARTTDKHSGDYALVVHNWYMYAWGFVSSHDTISYRPTFLTGYYKYDNEPGAQGSISIALTKHNGSANDTIGEGILHFDGQSAYTFFQVEIQYDDAITIPDSVHIQIISSNQNCVQEMVCNLLYVDDLMLSSSPANVFETSIDRALLHVYPNPFSNQIRVAIPASVSNGEIMVYNSQGQIVRRVQVNGQNEVLINRENMSAGLYLLQVLNDDGVPIGFSTIVAD